VVIAASDRSHPANIKRSVQADSVKSGALYLGNPVETWTKMVQLTPENRIKHGAAMTYAEGTYLENKVQYMVCDY
jgi:hypothetical protein